MVNNENEKGIFSNKSVLAAACALFALIVILVAVISVSFVTSVRNGSVKLPLFGSKSREVSFFMDTDRGTYDFVELSIPEGEGPHPVVLMAHGFAGTLHSGGASELGKRLSEEGVLAARIDFDPYVEPERSAERTHEYPLSQMEDDAVKLLGLIVSDYGGDPENISLYGRSYGGRLVMRMANESSGGYDYQKLALVAPAGDAVAFQRYLGGEETYAAMKEQALAADNAADPEHDGDFAGADTSSDTDGDGGKAQVYTDAGDDSAADPDRDEDVGSANTETEHYPEKLGIRITPKWFDDVESYDPTEFGWKFGDKPVLLFYNTLDTVVYPDTSIRCAESYKNHEIVEVTTEDGHGYEMGYKKSELKDQIMEKIVVFLTDSAD